MDVVVMALDVVAAQQRNSPGSALDVVPIDFGVRALNDDALVSPVLAILGALRSGQIVVYDGVVPHDIVGRGGRIT